MFERQRSTRNRHGRDCGLNWQMKTQHLSTCTGALGSADRARAKEGDPLESQAFGRSDAALDKRAPTRLTICGSNFLHTFFIPEF